MEFDRSGNDDDYGWNRSVPVLIEFNANTSVCRFIRHQGNDGPFLALSLLQLALSTCGLCGNCLMFAVLRDVHLMHKNVRLLFASETLASMAICIVAFIRAWFNLFATTWPAISARTCALIEFPSTAAAFCLCISSLAIGFERLYATWRRQTTDELSRWVATMVVGLWLFILINTALVSFTASNTVDTCYCHNLLCFRWWVIAGTMFFYFGAELVALGLFFLVLFWNRRRLSSFGINSASHSLAERFQIANNIRTTETLLPTVILHGCCWPVVQTVGFYPKMLFVEQGLSPTVMNSLLTIALFAVLHCSIQPYLLIWSSSFLRRAVRRLFRRAGRRFGNVAGSTDNPETSTTNNNITAESCTRQVHVSVTTVRPFDHSKNFAGGLGKTKRCKSDRCDYSMTPEQHCELLSKYWN